MNRLAGWAAPSLFPFKPESVLRNAAKPPAEPVVPYSDGLINLFSRDEELLVSVPPVMSVTVERCTQLHNLSRHDQFPQERQK